MKLAWRIHGKRRSSKNLEGLYEVLGPGSNILKVRPTMSNIKEPIKAIVAVRKSDIAKIGTLQKHQKQQIPMKVYADRRGHRTSKKLIEERIQSHFKQFARKINGDKKMEHRRQEPGNSSSRSNTASAMRGRILKLRNFPALLNQLNNELADSQSILIIPKPSASTSALQQVSPAANTTTQNKRSTNRNRCSPSYYGFDNSSSDSAITAPPNRPRRAGEMQNYQTT